jgi:hypothetical protein
MVRLAFTAVYTSLIVTIESAAAQGLTPNCTLPFQSIAKHHPIDDTCAARGEVPDPPVAPNDPAHVLQNQAKNNFCATGTPALVTFTSFKKLQQKLDTKVPEAKHWTRDKLPADTSTRPECCTRRHSRLLIRHTHFLWRVGMDCLLIAAGHKLNVAQLSMTDMNPGSAFPHSARRIS